MKIYDFIPMEDYIYVTVCIDGFSYPEVDVIVYPYGCEVSSEYNMTYTQAVTIINFVKSHVEA